MKNIEDDNLEKVSNDIKKWSKSWHKEKEIMFRMEVGDEVVGKTINLLEAIKKGIDCVFIRLNEVLSETEMYELIDVKNEIAGVGCQIIGFPKLASQRTTMLATISNTQEEQLIVNIKKENQRSQMKIYFS